MRSTIRLAISAALAMSTLSRVPAQVGGLTQPDALVKTIQDELAGPITDDSKPDPKVPHGEFLHGTIADSKTYPGTENDFQVYVPAQYDPTHPACLLLKLDGLGDYEATVLDNLIAKKQLPTVIGVGLKPGTVWKDPAGTPNRRAVRFDRSYEFDSMNDHFPDFVLKELLPAVQKLSTHDGRPINLSPSGNDHAVMGASTGGIGSFTLAWRRPDQFTRVYSEIGTFVSMRGGHEYPALIRKTDPKPIRIFLEDGSTDAWNPLFGSWYDANLNLDSALKFAGYDVAHAWGIHGHTGGPGQVILPDVMRWLWRNFPAPINAGISNNSTLQELTSHDEGWQQIQQSFEAAAGLTANGKGEVYFSDTLAKCIYRVGVDGKPVIVSKGIAVVGQAFGPDGSLFSIAPEKKAILKLDTQGASHVVAKGITGRSLIAAHNGTLYVSEPGAHNDEPSRIWRIRPAKENMAKEETIADEGLLSAAGVAFSPDGSLFYAAEKTSRWVYSYVVRPDGSFEDKQRFYWLHITDVETDSGAEDLAVDTNGNLYVGTRMGIQVCDQNGRVRAILPLPAPSGPVRSLCFGGEHVDVLYVTDGTRIFMRRLKVRGFAPWAAPISVPSQGAG